MPTYAKITLVTAFFLIQWLFIAFYLDYIDTSEPPTEWAGRSGLLFAVFSLVAANHNFKKDKIEYISHIVIASALLSAFINLYYISI